MKSDFVKYFMVTAKKIVAESFKGLFITCILIVTKVLIIYQ